jgi:tetratricopeptide (TPR) repeat protein
MTRCQFLSVHTHCKPLFLLLAAFLLTGNAFAAENLDREFEFASGLVDIGFSDYAERVVEQVLRKHPDQKDRAKLIRAEILIAGRKFDDAKALVESMPADNPKAQAIKLALATAYYRVNDIDQARKLYEEFFAQYKGRVPTDTDLRRFYQEAAYQYGQMLEDADDMEGAIEAYNRVLATKPEETAARKLKAEIAQKYVNLAINENDDRWLDEAERLCNEIQWGGLDIFFGQSIITMARVKLVKGDEAGARDFLRDNIDLLKEIDKVLKQQDALLKESPMAGARFLLGKLYQDEGENLLRKKDQQEAGIQALAKSLREYYNVFAKYGESDWGSQAGVRAKEVKERLEGLGKTVKIDLGEYAGKAATTQFRLADNLYRQGKYQESADEYLRALKQFPESDGAPAALTSLALCYAELNNPLYMKMIAQYLGERFGESDKAALGLLTIGKWYFDKQDREKYLYLYESYLDHFPEHDRAAAILYTLAGLAKKEGDEEGAIKYYERIIQNYPDDQYYLKALRRIAWDHYLAERYEEAVEAFGRYVEAEQPGHDKAQAQYTMADGLRKLDAYKRALSEYAKVLKWVDADDSQYHTSIEDEQKNRELARKALFQIGYCYGKVDAPDDQLSAFRQKGIQFYQLYLKKYPESELAPAAMNGMGTMQLELNNYDEAVATFDELAAKYPESEEGKNALFSLLRSSMEVNKFDVARDALKKMLNRASAYGPAEFNRVGQLMLNNELYREAISAFRQVRNTSQERAHLERALFGLGKANFELGQYDEAVKYVEELMGRYPKSGLFYEAKFILGNAYRETGRLDEAITAIGDVSKFAEDVVTINRANYTLGQIQKQQEEYEAAMASFQRVALLADAENPELRPMVRDCILEAIDVGMKIGRYQDVQDSCDQFLQVFPDSDRISEIRKIKADAKLKASQAAVGALEPDSQETE